MAGGWECDSEFDAMGFLSATSDTPNTAATWISGFCQTNLSPIFRSHLGSFCLRSHSFSGLRFMIFIASAFGMTPT